MGSNESSTPRGLAVRGKKQAHRECFIRSDLFWGFVLSLSYSFLVFFGAWKTMSGFAVLVGAACSGWHDLLRRDSRKTMFCCSAETGGDSHEAPKLASTIQCLNTYQKCSFIVFTWTPEVERRTYGMSWFGGQ